MVDHHVVPPGLEDLKRFPNVRVIWDEEAPSTSVLLWRALGEPPGPPAWWAFIGGVADGLPDRDPETYRAMEPRVHPILRADAYFSIKLSSPPKPGSRRRPLAVFLAGKLNAVGRVYGGFALAALANAFLHEDFWSAPWRIMLPKREGSLLLVEDAHRKLLSMLGTPIPPEKNSPLVLCYPERSLAVVVVENPALVGGRFATQLWSTWKNKPRKPYLWDVIGVQLVERRSGRRLVKCLKVSIRACNTDARELAEKLARAFPGAKGGGHKEAAGVDIPVPPDDPRGVVELAADVVQQVFRILGGPGHEAAAPVGETEEAEEAERVLEDLFAVHKG